MTRRNSSGEARRRKLLRFLQNPEPAWREEDHPEFRGKSSAQWVRELRLESERRIAEASDDDETRR
jgi:hypothetical protein